MTGTPLIDRAAARARDGRLTVQTVLWTLAASTVYVASGEDPGEDRGGMRPVYFETAGGRMLAVYSSPEAASGVTEVAPFLVAFGGEELLHTMPASDGMVVNPGGPLAFDVPAAGLEAFRQELSATA